MYSCPRCGFSYAWDGATCGHCRPPDAPPPTEAEQDDRLEARILYIARRHGLPAGRTHRFADLAPGLQESMRRGGPLSGRPVLAFVDSPARWTLLTTREVVSQDNGRLWRVALLGLSSVGNASEPPEGLTPEEFGIWKGSWEYLRIAGGDGQAGVVWVPPGGQAYALWDILLKFTRRPEGRR